MSDPGTAFRPQVASGERQPEFTLRALLLGSFLGIVFGASSTYLALRVGLTVAATVPIAVLAIALLRPRPGTRAILEHTTAQTAGSAGESIAAGIAFTVPALIFLGHPMEVSLTTLIAFTGGVLGVLMMVPLRRYLIVKEHGTLRYPEGRASAEILAAGERAGASARKVFVGMGLGLALKAVVNVLGGVKQYVGASLGFFKGASVACAVDPALLGVGYIIGYRIALMMVAGSLLASFVLVPMIVLFSEGRATPLPPAPSLPESFADAAGWAWNHYVRHIGAGAVAAGGLFALGRALPQIVAALRGMFASVRGGSAAGTERTDRDTPAPVLLAGVLAMALVIWVVPVFEADLLATGLVLVFAFLFCVVASRITGEVGTSSMPLSGMTIAVLMGTCGFFLVSGRGGTGNAPLALVIGAIVCVALSNAGTCSQDLKTGFLTGATPFRQQGALLVGVLTSVLAVGWTAYLLNEAETREVAVTQPFAVPAGRVAEAATVTGKGDGRTYRFVRLDAAEVPQGVASGNYLVDPGSLQAVALREDGIGSGRLLAPQARLMSVVVDGLLGGRLPWDLILIGVAIAVFIELMGFRSLTFAVGVYLPLDSTLPVFLGGLARRIADRVYRREPDAEEEPEGTLFCSGLIAGASILGILAALQGFLPDFDPDTGLVARLAVLAAAPFAQSDLFGWLVLAGLGAVIVRAARAK